VSHAYSSHREIDVLVMWAMQPIFLACILVCSALTVAHEGRKYSEVAALEYAKLASAAYCGKQAVEHWDCPHCKALKNNITDIRVCKAPADYTIAFVGRWEGDCVLSIEGTGTWTSMWTDLEWYQTKPVVPWWNCTNCEIHAGYMSSWKGYDSCVQEKFADIGCSRNTSKLRITGHSMGAAISAIAMMSLEAQGWTVREGYNFGMPRTGNRQFAAAFSEQFAGRFWRLTHHKDIIVQVPPEIWKVRWSYQHVGSEIFYNHKVDDGYLYCGEPEDFNCSKRYWDMLFDDWGMSDHLHYMDMPVGLASCKNGSVAAFMNETLVLV
jgi:hypothetical protein